MLTPVERVLILRCADLLREIGPRHLIGLADVAREIKIEQGETIYTDEDPADALYIVVEGRVRLSTGDRTMSEVGPGEAFGTWSLVDDSARSHRAECIEAGMTLAVHREEFYDLAAGDLTLLTELVRVLAKRLRALVVERPEEARIEGEGIEKPDVPEPVPVVAAPPPVEVPVAPVIAATAVVLADTVPVPAGGAALAAAALGHARPESEIAVPVPEAAE